MVHRKDFAWTIETHPTVAMAPSWLEDIEGDWDDTNGNHYEVWIDESGSSCSVRTTRKNGHVKTTRGMLKYDSRSDTLMWGRSYYMEMEENDNSKIHWTPLKAVQAYTWFRSEDEAEGSDETWESSGESGNAPILQQVVGNWRDDDGTIYRITMDESGSSCSATIEHEDGRCFESKENIACSKERGGPGIHRDPGRVWPVLQRGDSPAQWPKQGRRLRCASLRCSGAADGEMNSWLHGGQRWSPELIWLGSVQGEVRAGGFKDL
eukprot:Skav204155  [mRNA]  locus=scaffold903:269162:277661:+ [translate_table: standard]